MRYFLVMATAAAGLSLATPSFAEGMAAGEGFKGAGGCSFRAAQLESLIAAKTPEPAPPATAAVGEVLALPQIASLLRHEPILRPKPATQR